MIEQNGDMGREILPGVLLLPTERIATKSAACSSVYGEKIVNGHRIWDPYRSKLAALLLKVYRKGGSCSDHIPVAPSSKVLYLGAATGTTVSHVSDILSKGLVYSVEISVRAMRDLIILCEARRNIIPILGDAARPERYKAIVEPVDLIYQDVAQRAQAQIAMKNVERYLLPGGTLILMIKSRSIDSTALPAEVFCKELKLLQGMEMLQTTDLLPYHRDHLAVVARLQD
jgi:fibrillarin-like pre-rRNA processing protein